MTIRRVAGTAALVAAAASTGLGIAIGLFVLLAPTQVTCELPALQPGAQLTGTNNCVRVSVFESGQGLFPLPLVPIVLWSLAPTLSVIGVLGILKRRRGLSLVVTAAAIEATAIVSFVAGPMFLIYVFFPLVLTGLLAAFAAFTSRPFTPASGH